MNLSSEAVERVSVNDHVSVQHFLLILSPKKIRLIMRVESLRQVNAVGSVTTPAHLVSDSIN
jgi:hypothetical protein